MGVGSLRHHGNMVSRRTLSGDEDRFEIPISNAKRRSVQLKFENLKLELLRMSELEFGAFYLLFTFS
jgi:hypothetical protein